MSTNTITSADVVSQFGSYYIDAGQGIENLRSQLFATAETETQFPLRITDDTIFRNASTTQTRVLQPFQKGWTPVGDLTFEPLVTPMYRFKIELEMDPEELISSWLGFLTSDSIDRTQWPFVRWWLEQEVLKKHQEDRELNEVYLGGYAAPTAGTPGAASTGMDGIRTQIRALHTAGASNMITLGAIPTGSGAAAAFCTYVETFIKSLPPLIQKMGGIINMNYSMAKLYREGKRTKYSTLTLNIDKDLDTVTDYENFSVQGNLSHGSSQMIWYAPQSNKVRLMKAGSNENVFKVETLKRQVYAFTDYWFGVGFIRADQVFHSDLDLS